MSKIRGITMKFKKNKKYYFTVTEIEKKIGLDYTAEGFDGNQILSVTVYNDILSIDIEKNGNADSVDTFDLIVSKENNPEFNKWIQEQIKGEIK